MATVRGDLEAMMQPFRRRRKSFRLWRLRGLRGRILRLPARHHFAESSISIARLRGTLRASATMGVEQKRTNVHAGFANRLSSSAIARSQVATSWQPAAVAMPWDSRDDGFRAGDNRLHQFRAAVIVSTKKMRPPSGSLLWAVSSFRSWPAQKRRSFGGEHDGRNARVVARGSPVHCAARP